MSSQPSIELHPPHDGSDVGATLRRASTLVAVGILPAVATATMFVVAVTRGPLAWDFRNELYPQADLLLHGHNPYPHSIWPPLAMAVAAPFTALPSTAAGVVFAAVGLGCIGLALRLVGVRDWRVYGVTALWPSVLADIRIAHLTPLLCLLAAIAWRYRDRRPISGLALGAACGLKFLLWPVGIWLVATGRIRAAGVAACVGTAALLTVAPFAPVGDYVHTLRNVAARFDQDSYSVFGFLTQLGAADGVARGATYAVGGVLLVLVWQRRSFALAIAAGLVLSPIVWLDFFALAAIPLAIGRPRLFAIWFLPLLTWGLPSSGIDADPIFGVGRLLAVFTVVFIVAERGFPE